MFFGGLNGLVLVNSKDIYVEEFNPQLIFTGITKYDGKKDSLVYFNLHPEEPVTIGAYDNSFTFHFTSTDYFNTEQITYSYKIEGLDNYWTSIGKENQVRFNRLPAGNYTFKVRTIGSDGLWNKKPLSVPLIIEEVFYKTTWFLILSILFVALLIASIYKYRLNQLKRLHALRLKIAGDLHDDVGSILTQISLQSDLIGQDIYTTEEQKEEIEKMAANSRKAVKSMSDVLWSIDSRRDHAGDLADRMRDYLQEMFERTAIQYDFKAINLKEKKRLNVLVKQNIYLIFKEAINNIIKHSNASKVKIKIEELNGKLQLEIKDNGTLSKNEGSLPGQGLQNIKMRAESLKGTLNIDTAKGYALLVEVPI